MTWFFVDDSFHAHPKAIAAGNAAVGLWTRCGSWVGSHLTDGHVPSEVAAMYGTKTEARRLVESGLWERDTQRGGYVMHDYLDWNKSRAEVEAQREVRARAGRAGGKRSGKVRASKAEAKAQANASSLLEQTPSTDEAKTNPDPTHTQEPQEQTPSVLSADKPRTKRGTRIPDDFAVTPDMVAWAQQNTPDVDGRFETAQFVDYWHAKSGAGATKLDWRRTWQTWMRNAQQRAPHRPSNVVALRGADRPPTPSTTDQRVNQALALAAKYAALEDNA